MSNLVSTIPVPPGWVSYCDMHRGIIVIFDPTLRDPNEIVAMASGDKEVLEISLPHSSVNPS